MNDRRMKWARDIERVRRIYEIRQQCEEYTESLRRSDRVIDGQVPREVRRMLFTDWDRVLDRVWTSYDRGAYYEAIMLHRLFDDVRLENEWHVSHGAEGWVRSCDPDGSIHEYTETFGHDTHRYKCVEHAEDAAWLLAQMCEVLDMVDGSYKHYSYMRHVMREDWA